MYLAEMKGIMRRMEVENHSLGCRPTMITTHHCSEDVVGYRRYRRPFDGHLRLSGSDPTATPRWLYGFY
jgi:hypothetical protein